MGSCHVSTLERGHSEFALVGPHLCLLVPEVWGVPMRSSLSDLAANLKIPTLGPRVPHRQVQRTPLHRYPSQPSSSPHRSFKCYNVLSTSNNPHCSFSWISSTSLLAAIFLIITFPAGSKDAPRVLLEALHFSAAVQTCAKFQLWSLLSRLLLFGEGVGDDIVSEEVPSALPSCCSSSLTSTSWSRQPKISNLLC